jgi:2Fe-2S ferredoxin
MGIIKFINHEGKQHVVELEDGKSLMQLAMDNGVQGIDADCGGECACGTCHVMVGKQWLSLVGSPNNEELQMLEMTPEKQANSRLSCQIKVTDAMDGMEVHVPEFQM